MIASPLRLVTARRLPTVAARSFAAVRTASTVAGPAAQRGATTGQRLASSLALKPQRNYQNYTRILAGCVGGITVLQAVYGSSSDFYEYRYITNKDPDDLASFFGGEEFMEIFCVFPFVGTIMMRNGEFDDEGTVHTQGIPGDLQVSMVFSSEDDDETGQTVWFNKRERFKDVFWNMKMWDMVTNFGFQRLPDGRVECYHHGEYFVGNIPPISLLIKLVFRVHARWVAWATEHHINHHAFTAETEEEEEMEELSRSNVVWYMIKYHFLKDLRAMVFGASNDEQKKQPDDLADYFEDNLSFLVKDRENDKALGETIAIKRRQSMNRIAMDIMMDKEMPQSEVDIEIDAEKIGAYQKLTKSAMHRHETLRAAKRISNRRASMREKQAVA